jgi:hypothetical protein
MPCSKISSKSISPAKSKLEQRGRHEVSLNKQLFTLSFISSVGTNANGQPLYTALTDEAQDFVIQALVRQSQLAAPSTGAAAPGKPRSSVSDLDEDGAAVVDASPSTAEATPQ